MAWRKREKNVKGARNSGQRNARAVPFRKNMDKFDEAIELFKMGSRMSLRYQDRPIAVTYSGGKDSDVLLEVAIASGEPFEVHNNHTTADAPQTVYHIRNRFKKLEEKGIKCVIEYPKYKDHPVTMWSLIPQKLMPPTRLVRYCCSVLKERGCADRVIATGVRWAESGQRKSRKQFEVIASKKKNSVGYNEKDDGYDQLSFLEDTSEIMLQNDNDVRRKVIEHCQIKNKIAVNPIIQMSDKDVWDILRWLKAETNPLYKMGYDRVGCIGCPMAGSHKREREFRDFPTYKQAYINAFNKMIEVRKRKGLETKWNSGEEVFEWSMEYDDMEGQESIFDFPEVLP